MGGDGPEGADPGVAKAKHGPTERCGPSSGFFRGMVTKSRNRLHSPSRWGDGRATILAVWERSVREPLSGRARMAVGLEPCTHGGTARPSLLRHDLVRGPVEVGREGGPAPVDYRGVGSGFEEVDHALERVDLGRRVQRSVPRVLRRPWPPRASNGIRRWARTRTCPHHADSGAVRPDLWLAARRGPAQLEHLLDVELDHSLRAGYPGSPRWTPVDPGRSRHHEPRAAGEVGHQQPGSRVGRDVPQRVVHHVAGIVRPDEPIAVDLHEARRPSAMRGIGALSGIQRGDEERVGPAYPGTLRVREAGGRAPPSRSYAEAASASRGVMYFGQLL